MSNLFVEDEYYLLLLVDELKQRYDIETVLDLLIRLKPNKKRIWLNLHDVNEHVYNSFFVDTDNLAPKWDEWIVLNCSERGFYDRYYIINCMRANSWQKWHSKLEIAKRSLEKARQEQKRIEEQKRLYGKQYNMFGGMD